MAVIAVLAIVAVYTLNPSQFFAQGNDANRVAGISSIDKAVSLYYSSAMENPSTMFMGTSSVIYVSIPDPTATTTAGTNCSGIGLVSTASTTYHCAASSTYLNVNGTGWIPINFTTYLGGSPLSSLPKDPINTVSSSEYFAYTTDGMGGYEIMGVPQSTKYASNTADFVRGTNLALVTSFPSSGGGTSGNNTVTGVAVSCSPSTLYTNGTSTCSATVSGTGSYSSGVIWSTTSGSVDSSGNYTAPGSAGTATVTACSSQAGYTSVCGSSGALAISNPQNIWVVDGKNYRVEEFSSTGTYESQLGCASGKCSSGSGNGQFNKLLGPDSIAIDGSGNIWVVDNGNKRVEEFSSTGTYESQFGSSGSGNGQFNNPQGIAIDGSGNIWVVDSGNQRVQEFSSTGTYESQIGSYGTGNGYLIGPTTIAIDASGNIWVGDTGYDDRVEEFSSTGTYESQLGCASGACSSGSGNGQFNEPTSIGIDASGNIWVADFYNNRVEEFSSAGTYESQLGCASGACSSGSGNGQFSDPNYGIAIDASGNIWVVDNVNRRVEEFSSTGTYESQLGCASGACSSGSGNGQFQTIAGIAVH